MIQTIRRLGVFATLLAATSCMSAPEEPGSPGLGARVEPLDASTTVTTVMTLVNFVCNESSSGTFGVYATIPTFVAPGETFPVTFALRFVPAILTPDSGVLDLRGKFKAARATPASVDLQFDPLTFAARSALDFVGTETTSFTAASQVGQPVKLRFPSTDYTVTWTSGTRPTLVQQCNVPETSSPLVATIPIVNEPQTKNDCKNGGYASHTDDTGKVFKNQGQCVKYVGGS